MKLTTYVFGIFEYADTKEPIETVVLGIDCKVTAHSLLDALLGKYMPMSGQIRLIQTTVFDPQGYIEWHRAVCMLCVPIFTAMKDSWPKDEWHTLTPDLDLQLCSDFDSANNEIKTAYIYPVEGKQTDTKSILLYSTVYSIDDFIKKCL